MAARAPLASFALKGLETSYTTMNGWLSDDGFLIEASPCMYKMDVRLLLLYTAIVD